ncbi:hypothetical protein LCGC14_2383970 [marine sediment metagenome]|uniref:AAA+ ATPase domain-containing protein n=1 Tax=marine sediment metagenome TaxID=412755 RepID=A0A0F9CM84_9ZZZZ
MINLHNKTFAVFGLRGTGKSVFVNKIATSFGKRAMVFDTLNEVPDTVNYMSYSPKVKNSVAELEMVIKAIVDSKEYRAFIIDEANRYCPSKPSPLPSAVADLNDQCRHYGISVGYVARRPTQLNQDVTELAEYLFIFHLKGKSDIQYLNNLAEGLGQAVLSCHDYQFIQVNPDRSFQLCSPVKPDKVFLDRARIITPK